MTASQSTTVEIRDNAPETVSVSWWGWPDEAGLAALAEQDVRARENDREEKIDRTLENNAEFAALYFVS